MTLTSKGYGRHELGERLGRREGDRLLDRRGVLLIDIITPPYLSM